jgi:hypothetical protein
MRREVRRRPSSVNSTTRATRAGSAVGYRYASTFASVEGTEGGSIMNMVTKLVLSIMGTFIVGAGGYYQVHSAGPFDTPFWISFAMAGVIPLGTYFLGLAQKAPWDK